MKTRKAIYLKVIYSNDSKGDQRAWEKDGGTDQEDT